MLVPICTYWVALYSFIVHSCCQAYPGLKIYNLLRYFLFYTHLLTYIDVVKLVLRRLSLTKLLEYVKVIKNYTLPPWHNYHHSLCACIGYGFVDFVQQDDAIKANQSLQKNGVLAQFAKVYSFFFFMMWLFGSVSLILLSYICEKLHSPAFNSHCS